MIWASSADQVMAPFFEATGLVIGPNMKLLVKAKPTIHTAYGMTLVIEGIDPAYSLGDLEARKREVRARLQAEGIWPGSTMTS